MIQLLLLALVPVCVSVREQSIAVKGRLLCGDQPAANVRVKLWEEDTGPDPDDLLDQGYTNSNGEFQLQGGTIETTPIDPVLKVYHDCNDVTGFLGVPKLLLLALVPVCVSVREQSIAVKGRLLCGDQPAANVRVKLWEEDTGPDPDDLLDQGYTNSNGEFQLQGGTIETTPIDPVLKVYHDCNDPGSRKVRFSLPDKYISDGMVPKKVMDIGVINLELEFQSEGREFIVD
ncbi:Transthyretin-like family protein [Ancylostoma caninum]|uniref:Transthyretin-like family protein n=1 Tax=Ancylostoma caninum TaxID=29170 RepID=A0A368FIY2_ANCCA|nr:Transthyretin-like family protein [Ancylostoma caninum]